MTANSTSIATITGNTLKSVQAWQTGHFILTSGKHSSEYMQCQKVMQYPRLGNLLADLLIDKVISDGITPDVVVGPALGAIHWEIYVAQALERYKQKVSYAYRDTASSIESLEEITNKPQGEIESLLTKAVFAEKVKDENDEVSFEIRRGIQLDEGTKVLVVEDVTTTGGSARKVVDMIRSIGCDPVCVGAVVDRSGGAAKFDVPFISLLELNLETYDPENCPLCKAGIPAIKPGSPNK